MAIHNGRTGDMHKNLIDVIDRWYPGDYKTQFESDMVSLYYGDSGGYCIGVNSGTSALLAALAGVGVVAGDEVIVPSFTFSAPAFAVEQLGAKCKFADINPFTWNIGPAQIEPLITSRTKAIIVVHLYGLPADMLGIMKLARAYDLRVIEDCAETFLGSIYDQYVGTFGDMAIFSFEKSKHITSGDGGAVISQNTEYAERARKFSILGYSTLRAFGSVGTKDDIQHPDFNRHYSMGYNFRLPELCAAVLCAQLEKAQELVDIRIRNGKIYHEVVKDYIECLSQSTSVGYVHTYWTYAFLLPNAFNAIGEYEQHQQIQAYEQFRNEYLQFGGHKFFAGWKCVPDEPYFKKAYPHVDIPVARIIQRSVICLNTSFKDAAYTKIQAELLREGFRRI
jgi:perosamine synthetase